ncbi:kelch repeat-containing protein [Geothrix fermentans]|uniref:kelch repeat-containing protein n=1 Tax=Geothrix fermentans TaxID=44676 RepID=UPI00146F9C2F|nr:kelch repeat-containing protein [Geothrix fermentans]
MWEPIGDGIYPIGFIQRASIGSSFETPAFRGSYIVFYDSVKNAVVVSEDLKIPLGTRWIGMTAQGDSLIELMNNGAVEPWRVKLNLPVTTFPASFAIPLGEPFKLSCWTAKTEPITWSVLEGAVGGTVAQDGTYHAPTTAGIYHVVATTASGRSVSTVRVIPTPPIVNDLVLDKVSGQAGTVVNVTWNTQWADAIHLQMRDNSGTVLQDLDVMGVSTASMTATSATASFALVASNASGIEESRVSFTQWAVWNVSINPSGTQYMPAGTIRSFTASISGTQGTPSGVTWSSVPAGAITVEGIFTAPVAEGSYTVTATSLFDPTKSATSTVVVGIPATLASFTASPTVVPAGAPTTLSWQSTGATYQVLTTPPDQYGNGGQSWNVTSYSSFRLYPTKTTTYTLSVSNYYGGAAKDVQVIVSPITAIGITPTNAIVYTGIPLSFGSSITSTGSTAVTWSTDDPKGAISGIGLSATYTPGNTPGSFHVTVTSVLDPTRSATAVVTVIRPQVTLSITPLNTALMTGQSLSLGSSIQVTGSSDTSIVWSCSGGNILPKGAAAFYTAPLIPGLYTVTATSTANPDVSAITTIQVSAPSSSTPTLSILPQAATLQPGQRLFLGTAYATTDPSLGLDWAATGGNLAPDASTASAFFSSPAAGAYTVTATSRATPSLISPPAGITVNAAQPLAWAVMPSALTLGTGQSTLFEAMDSSGAIRPKVQWTILEGTAGGLVTDAGQYFAPTTVGVYHLVGINPDDPSQTATATITVLAGGGGSGSGNATPTNQGVAVAPDTVSIPSGTYQSFSAVVAGLDDQSVTWVVENGPATATVDTSGVFVANQPGTYRVFATSTVNPVLNGSAVITVVSSVTPLAGAPSGAWKGYSVTSLQNGKILIAGGYDGASYLSTAYLYDPDSKTFAPTGGLLQARGWHTATLLNDGRVLIAGGSGYFKWPTDPNAITQLQGVRWGEIYDPASGTFQALPVPPGFPTFPAGFMRGAHSAPTETGDADSGAAALLANGQVLVVGGTDDPNDYWINRSDVFIPATGTFDLTNLVPDPNTPGSYMWVDSSNYVNTWIGTAVVKLLDGRVLMTGGGQKTSDGGRVSLSESKIFDGASQTFTTVAPMLTPRLGHTLTVLSDGRVLATGGYQAFQLALDGWWYGISTNQSEIYDPASNIWTVAGNMSEARGDHAAILLPTGKVMVVGGITQYGDGSKSWPKTSELFDPDSGTFSVMDHLDYGLSEPKLALLQDGSVFVAGQVQAPMEPPAQQSQSNGLKMMAAADLAGNTLTSGSTLMGVISSSWNVIACPEEASLKYDKVAKVLAPEIGDTWHEGLIPKKATISVPMAGGVNEENRYFILKIKKPSPNYSITGFAVTLKAGNQNQVVNGPISADYSQLFSRSDVTYYHGLPAPPGDPTDEAEREYLRKQWLQAWLPASTPSDHVTEFYKVRVTMKTNAPSAIQYGVNGQLPPSDTLNYEFKIYYTLNGVSGQPFTLPPWNVPTIIQAHWDASQLFQGQSYGTRNNDQWCNLSTFSWVSDPAKRGLLEPVNDISLEHGRNTGHSYSHLDGRQADMYHPAYTTFIGSVSNTSGTQFRDTQLIPTLQRARGWVERDANYQPIRTVPSDPDAVRKLAQWIRNARVKIRDFMTVDTVGPFGLNSFIYMSTAGDGYPQFVAEAQQLRDLMLTGACIPLSAPWTDGTTSGSIWYSDLNLTNNPAIQPESDRPQPWGVDDKQWIGDTTPQGVHTNHLHLQWGTKSKNFLN